MSIVETEIMFLESQPRRNPKGAGLQRSQIFGTPTYARIVWHVQNNQILQSDQTGSITLSEVARPRKTENILLPHYTYAHGVWLRWLLMRDQFAIADLPA